MPSTPLRETRLTAAKHVVVKIGTQLITGGAKGKSKPAIDTDFIANLAAQIVALRKKKINVTLVSSGAVGAGCVQLARKTRPTDVAEQQAVAAIGQRLLVTHWHDALHHAGALTAAQVLLTRADFDDRLRYLNIRNCVAKLHELKAVPVLNENDTVAVDEIRFGDNDLLAALTCSALKADALVLLTSVPGLLDAQGNVIDRVDDVLDQLQHVRREKSTWGSGGMQTKLEAARVAVESGELAVIADGREPDILTRLLAGERLGTVFAPAQRRLDSRQRWIGLTARPAGTVAIDAGAAEALTKKATSLLATGVTGLTGRFNRGDVIMLCDPSGREVARGLCNYTADELRLIQGKKSNQLAAVLGRPAYKAVVHRDNLVVL